MAAARAPWSDLAVFALHVAAAVIVARHLAARWRATAAASIARHHARRDALARATAPRSLPR